VDQRGRETLVIEVAGRCFGLPASAVRELVRAVAIVPLPRAGPGVEGVVNLRGRVVPVIDLRERLGLPARPVMPSDHLIMAQSGDLLAALRVDRALDLVRLDAASDESSSVAAGSTAATERATEGVKVVRLADGLAPLLDLRVLFEGVATPETLGVATGVTDEAETEGGAP
jgi:purine-binding chemotaxis protein CheW